MKRTHLMLLSCVFLIIGLVGQANSRSLLCGKCNQHNGFLDVTFGNHGQIITSLLDAVVGVTVLPCGTIVATGPRFINKKATNFGLTAFTSYGVSKQSFGINGVVYTDFATVLRNTGQDIPIIASVDVPTAIVLQKMCGTCTQTCAAKCHQSCVMGDKLVVVGSSNATVTKQSHFALARYNSDGTLDTSFGTNGVVVTPIGMFSSGANAVAIQADNKIVVAGFTFFEFSPETEGRRFAVTRYNCDGSLDTTFGCNNSGMVEIGFGESSDSVARAVKIQKNGKIVVAGSSNINGLEDFALVRLIMDGALDKSFGPDHTGKIITSFSDTTIDTVNALVLLENCGSCCTIRADSAQIVAVGSAMEVSNGFSSFALAGYKDNGKLDTAFGAEGTGVVTTVFADDMGGIAHAVAVRRDACTKECTIVAAGFAFTDVVRNIALIRYTIDGRLDNQFGDNGKVITSLAGSGAFSVALQCNGDIIAGGDILDPKTELSALLVRYNTCHPCCD